MKIYIGADHQGFHLKAELVDYLRRSGYDVADEGDKVQDPNDDFPEFAARVVIAMGKDPEAKGILICGSGQGMCMAANRYKGIRASLVWDVRSAQEVRNDDDANVLCLPARILKSDRANLVVHTWLNTPFAGAPRFKRRIAEMDKLGLS